MARLDIKGLADWQVVQTLAPIDNAAMALDPSVVVMHHNNNDNCDDSNCSGSHRRRHHHHHHSSDP